MTISVANVVTANDTFSQWIDKFNIVANALTTKVVTTDSNTTIGNSAISGTATSNNIVVTSNGIMGVGLSVGNSTVNTSISPTSIRIGNNLVINTSAISSGNSTVNTSIIDGVLFSSFAGMEFLGVTNASINYLTITTGFTVNEGVPFSVGNSTVNTSINSTSVSTPNIINVGNSTVNTVVNSTAVSTSALRATTLSLGNATVNTTANSTFISVTTLRVGNATVNSSVNSTALAANTVRANSVLSVGNSTVNTVINSTSLTVNTVTSSNTTVNNLVITTGFSIGNSTVNSIANSTSVTSATVKTDTLTANGTLINLTSNLSVSNTSFITLGAQPTSNNHAARRRDVGGEFLASVTATNFGGWVEFALPSEFASFEFEFSGVTGNSDGSIVAQISTNGGSTWLSGASDYSFGWWGSASPYSGVAIASSAFVLTNSIFSASTRPFNLTFRCFQPLMASATEAFTFNCLSNGIISGSVWEGAIYHGGVNVSVRPNRIRFAHSTSNFYGLITMKGTRP